MFGFQIVRTEEIDRLKEQNRMLIGELRRAVREASAGNEAEVKRLRSENMRLRDDHSRARDERLARCLTGLVPGFVVTSSMIDR